MLHSLEVKQLRAGSAKPVNFSLASGECIVIDGPSGSGKSRMLRAIADMDEYSGSVCLDQCLSQDWRPNEWRAAVGLMPAEPVWWADTVADHFLPNTQQLAALHLSKALLTRPITQLSSGERQRFALLRALHVEPKFLLLDEPTSQLDRVSTLAVESLLKALLEQQRVGLVWVSHDAEQRGRLAARSASLSLAGAYP